LVGLVYPQRQIYGATVNTYIPVNEPLLAGNEKKYLIDCVETAWVSSEGPYVKKFEDSFSARVHRQHGISVTNGTTALELAVIALGIGDGDEVIMPTFTIISCAAAVIRAGGIPVLVDCDPATWNMDTSQITEKITSRTKAIMAVHIYGLPVDMDSVIKIAEKNNLFIIEDAAEAIGTLYKGRPCGSFGDISIFSFYANKHVTTGEGGMVVTNDSELADRCRYYRNLCFGKERFIHEELGTNMRMTNIQAAIGLAQLERLDQTISRKRLIGSRYTEQLQDISLIQLPPAKTKYAENDYWVFGLVVDQAFSLDAKAVMGLLGEKKIGSRPFFWPMHEQPVLRRRGLFAGEAYPVSERIARRGFYIPCGAALTDGQLDRAAETLRRILGF